ncbi:MAG: tetratricopeptide repeat protein, partial [Parachlamydiaceae bacterium]|nr:tetratricopeptide repeat protein [Parachlamydiaceae bacterium]
AVEASFYLGVCYYEMKEYDFANVEFSSYLKASSHPVYFEEAVQYKFCMAERLKCGMKRRPFTFRYLPKCLKGEDLALTIYDEVVVALPNHELTVQALHSKAALLRTMREYRLCIETYQTIIRRFPSNPTVPVCYMEIANTYIEQSRYEFQNPDILALAELNAKKFSEDFPRDENVPYVNDSVLKIKESYARGLCNLGLFYERTGHPEAAMIYFQSAIEEFPDTHVAEYSRSRLNMLREQLNQLEEIRELNQEILIENGLLQENVCQEEPNLYQEEQVVSPQEQTTCQEEPCCAE